MSWFSYEDVQGGFVRCVAHIMCQGATYRVMIRVFFKAEFFFVFFIGPKIDEFLLTFFY